MTHRFELQAGQFQMTLMSTDKQFGFDMGPSITVNAPVKMAVQLSGEMQDWVRRHIRGEFEVETIYESRKASDVYRHLSPSAHSYAVHTSAHYIAFQDPADAVLFRLTWC
ncbi:hypothetical protein [Roseomonas chloroacetimidivorans]|uniref:hypothetical protein n=1 Tax=Roseomonas chloroacetimidivorans TaxID=1766656 RepID=UPI003C70F55C